MNKDKKYYVGKSNGLEISESMFNHVKNGKSINKIIESISNITSNKKYNGITGYLTNGFFKRAEFDMSAVLCALETYYNQDKYRDIDDKLN